VAKKGRKALTAGTVNHVKREAQWEPGETSREVEIMSRDAPFAAPGDTDSIVTNAQGEMVGLLFAIDACARHSSGFMMPITAIQQHVGGVTDGGFLGLD
jgi:S1-C subfamily serine protease